MIRVDLSAAVAVYLVLWIFGFLAAWAILERKGKLKGYATDARYVWHCRICTHTYIDSISEEISRCPLCNSYNERGAER